MQAPRPRVAIRVQCLLPRMYAGDIGRHIDDPDAVLVLRLCRRPARGQHSVWASAHKRPHIAEAMRSSDVVGIRQTAARLHVAAATTAIDLAQEGHAK